MKYRPEVDGLRAVAVIPVILFHAGFASFSGGFVGVDVFFVISGYLITTIILAELESDRFSILNFYERRARRILPALFFVLLVCIPFALMWMLPEDYISFSQSLVAVSTFSSNILFWSQSGYFDGAAELKPLLHTWSLAVEEQYYLLFPVFLMCVWRFGRQRVLLLLIIGLVISLSIAQWAALNAPSANFYLLPTRIWELLIGVLAAFFLLTQDRLELSRVKREVLCLLGVGLIFFAIFAFDEETPFPSLYALIPTLGAVLILIYADSDVVVGKVLSGKYIVGIGLLSYSSYLWHQPLFAFARLKSLGEPSNVIMLGISLSAIVLAYFTWKYVEAPFRDRKIITRVNIFTFSVVGCLVFIGIGFSGVVSKGFPHRLDKFSDEIRPLAQIVDVYDYYNYRDLLRDGICHSVDLQKIKNNNCIDAREKNLLIWGDSYAATLYKGLEYVRSLKYPHIGITQVTDANGPPFYGDKKTEDGKTLSEANDNRLEVARILKPEIVLMAWMIDGKNSLSTKELSLLELNKVIEKILKVSPSSRVVVVGPFPKWSGTLQKQMLAYYLKTGLIPPNYMSFGLVRDVWAWDDYFKQAVPGGKVSYISALDVFCRGKGCLTRVSNNLLNITALDWGHLSLIGSVFFATETESSIFPAKD